MRLKRHSVMVRFMFGALSVSCSNSPVEFAFELNKNICNLMIQARRKMVNLTRLVRKTKRPSTTRILKKIFISFSPAFELFSVIFWFLFLVFVPKEKHAIFFLRNKQKFVIATLFVIYSFRRLNS